MKQISRRNSFLRPNFFSDDVFDGIFRELSVDRVLDDVFGSSVGARANIVPTEAGSAIELEAPGLSKGDFKVEVDGGTLRVSSHVEKTGGDANHREFSRRSFSRSFTLPEGVRSGDIKASYDAGILRIEVPHGSSSKREPVTIDIA